MKRKLSQTWKLRIVLLVPQINRYLNLYFNYVIGTDHASIKYLEGVCPYTRKSKRKEYLESAQNGFAKMKIGILDGDTQLEQLSALYLENALGLSNLMTPLNTKLYSNKLWNRSYIWRKARI